jgi:hypothetical protein
VTSRNDVATPLTHLFIVTDSIIEFQQIIGRLNTNLNITRLYADYLRSFEINASVLAYLFMLLQRHQRVSPIVLPQQTLPVMTVDALGLGGADRPASTEAIRAATGLPAQGMAGAGHAPVNMRE